MMEEPEAKTATALLFRSITEEVTNSELKVKGEIPEWLTGSFVRNGPGQFEVGNTAFQHWFDGFSLLHKFEIKNGSVSYSSKFLNSEDYQENTHAGKITSRGFGTVPDPCASIFSKFFGSFSKPNPDNANVNILKSGSRMAAVSDFSNYVEFDLATLETKGRVNFNDKQSSSYYTSASHPAFDPDTKEFFNCLGELGPSGKFHIYKLGGEGFKRDFIAHFKAKRNVYFHSFALTKKYFVFIEQPLQLAIFKLMFSRVLNIPYEKSYKWKPETGMKYHVLNRATGELRTYTSESYFFFHTVNAFDEDNKIVIDLCRYENPDIIQKLYLNDLKTKGILASDLSKLYRITIDLETGTVNSRLLSQECIDLPGFNYTKACRKHRYVYGFGLKETGKVEFNNQLIKIDTETGESSIWREDDAYPSEPVFVGTPNPTSEDDGVLLSVVLNATRKVSYLVILDAKRMKEIARAEAAMRIPVGLHGMFYKDSFKGREAQVL